jgi:hypothetical protein
MVVIDSWSRQPAAVGAPTAEELAERVLQRLLRGGTWEGLANEIAWKAARSTGADASCLEWLPALVADALSQRIDGLEFVLERTCLSARAEYLRERPHDVGGAETAATLAADEEGMRHLGRLYVDVLEWATGLLEDRLGQSPTSRRQRRDRPPADTEIPALVADSLSLEPTRYGWPSRRAV